MFKYTSLIKEKVKFTKTLVLVLKALLEKLYVQEIK